MPEATPCLKNTRSIWMLGAKWRVRQKMGMVRRAFQKGVNRIRGWGERSCITRWIGYSCITGYGMGAAAQPGERGGWLHNQQNLGEGGWGHNQRNTGRGRRQRGRWRYSGYDRENNFHFIFLIFSFSV